MRLKKRPSKSEDLAVHFYFDRLNSAYWSAAGMQVVTGCTSHLLYAALGIRPPQSWPTLDTTILE